jgi:hypothetical protein
VKLGKQSLTAALRSFMECCGLDSCVSGAWQRRGHVLGHARRKIWDVHQTKATAATSELLERIGGLYTVAQEVRGHPPDIRRGARQLRSKPQLEELKERMEAIRAKLSAKSALTVAITYALKRWLALTRYVDDRRLEIDNLVAIGRRRIKNRRRTRRHNLFYYRNLQA